MGVDGAGAVQGFGQNEHGQVVRECQTGQAQLFVRGVYNGLRQAFRAADYKA